MDDGWGNAEKPKRGWFKKKTKPQPKPDVVKEATRLVHEAIPTIIEKVVDEAPKSICPLIEKCEKEIADLKTELENAKRMTLIYKDDRDKLKAVMDKAVLELKGA